LKSRVSEMLFQHSLRDISSKNKSKSSIKSHVFSDLASDIAEIFQLEKTSTCVACWGYAKNQRCKTASV